MVIRWPVEILKVAGLEDADHLIADVVGERLLLPALEQRREIVGGLVDLFRCGEDLLGGALGAARHRVELAHHATVLHVAEPAGVQGRDLLLGADDGAVDGVGLVLELTKSARADRFDAALRHPAPCTGVARVLISPRNRSGATGEMHFLDAKDLASYRHCPRPSS